MSIWYYNILFMLAGYIGVCSAASPPTAINTWESLLNSKGTNLVFDEYAKTSPPWPIMARLSPGKETSPEIRYVRFIATATICDARKLVRETSTSPMAKRWARIDAAIRLRDAALQEGQYTDLVLADALTRGIAVALCKQLGNESDGIDLKKSLARLKVHQIVFEKWVSVADNEFGISKEAINEIRKLGNEEDGFRSLWRVLSDSDDFFTPRDIQVSGSLDLVKSPNLALLIYRYVQTDILIKTLSLAVEYKSRAQDFSLNDSEDKIAEIIPAPMPTARYSLKRDGVQKHPVTLDPDKYSLGERILRLQVSFPEVARLLRSIKANEVDKQIFFDVTDIIPSK